MKKKTIKMLSSVAALGILCGAYAGVHSYMEKKEQDEIVEEETKTNVFSASAEDIEAVKFLVDKKETIFKKNDDSWVKEDESDFPVDQTKLNEIIEALENLEASRVLENVEETSEYGLDSPENTITVSTSDGTETIFRIGEENISTSQVYMEKEGDEGTVYVVDASFIEPFAGTLYDYAQMGEFPFIEAANITEIKVDGQETQYSITKDTESGFWDISDGTESEKADSAKASSLTSSVGGLEYSSFVNYDARDLSEYGLDKPFAEIMVEYEEVVEETEESEAGETGESQAEETDIEQSDAKEMVKKELKLYVGSEAENDSRYVRVNDSTEIYMISNETLSSLLDKTSADFWDMTVNYLSANELDQLQVTYNGKTSAIDVSRETTEGEDGETEEKTTYLADNKEVDSVSFSTFYNKLINMAAQKRLIEEYKPEKEAEMTVIFKNAENNEKTVELYAYNTNYYAAVVDEKVYLINKMIVKEMFEAYELMISEEITESEDIQN